MRCRRDFRLLAHDAGADVALAYFPTLACRAGALAKAGAQIFFQMGEGAFKGVVVLPVREIGDAFWFETKHLQTILEPCLLLLSKQKMSERNLIKNLISLNF